VLRFQPDSWIEGLLRPLILLDPSGYLYIEMLAPDLRFAALLVLTGVALLLPKVRARLSMAARRTLGGLWLAFYVWTFAIGNGRYFIAGLLVVGPVLVLMVRLMPWTAAMRAATLVCLVALQALVVQMSFRHGEWALARWTEGPALPVPRPAGHDRPAVYITLSANSQSILVPAFHPASRWVNLVGQAKIARGLPEYEQWRVVIDLPLPRYAVLYSVRPRPDEGAQPEADEEAKLRDSLARYDLARDTTQPCELHRSHLKPAAATFNNGGPPALQYWICPLQAGEPAPKADPEPPAPPALDEVFARIEQYCPRFFPPGGGQPFVGEMGRGRTYFATDTRLVVDTRDRVMFQYFRATASTFIGTADTVRRGEFSFDCDKLPGRYVYPWLRG
jgi:hypothetical protein